MEGGSEVYARDRTRSEFVAGVRRLSAVATSAYGPAGQFTIIQPNAETDAIGVTTVSSRIFENIRVRDPCSRALLELVRSHAARIGDGGLFMLSLATALVHKALDGPTSAVSITTRTIAHERAMEALEAWLASPRCRFACALHWDCTSSSIAVIRGVIGPKQACGLQQDELELLCVLVLQAFLSALPSDTNPTVPFVRQVGAVGASAMESRCIDGVLLDLPGTFDDDRPIKRDAHLAVAVFDVPLEPTVAASSVYSMEAHIGTETLSQGSDCWSGGQAVMVMLTGLCDALAEAAVGAVLCQKGIHPQLQRLLWCRGIVAIERLSLRNMTAVRLSDPVSALRVLRVGLLFAI
jgi:chaperonin GroEL (HSP60 family)